MCPLMPGRLLGLCIALVPMVGMPPPASAAGKAAARHEGTGPGPQCPRSSVQDASSVTLLVEGMMKSRSGAT